MLQPNSIVSAQGSSSPRPRNQAVARRAQAEIISLIRSRVLGLWAIETRGFQSHKIANLIALWRDKSQMSPSHARSRSSTQAMLCTIELKQRSPLLAVRKYSRTSHNPILLPRIAEGGDYEVPRKFGHSFNSHHWKIHGHSRYFSKAGMDTM
jgi:hypothetical protein